MRRQAIRFMLLVAATAVPAGCVSLYEYQDVRFEVVDAASGRPRTDALVGTRYVAPVMVNPPEDAWGRTDDLGQVVLPVAMLDPRDGFVHVYVDGQILNVPVSRLPDGTTVVHAVGSEDPAPIRLGARAVEPKD